MNTILFDLDGTLLDVDKDKFIKTYFASVGEYFSDICDPKLMMGVLIKGTEVMTNDQSDASNKEVFVKVMEEVLGESKRYMERFDQYYEEVFPQLGQLTKPKEMMQKSISLLKRKGYKLVVATNPMFPEAAVKQRVKWTGIPVDDFLYVPSFDEHKFAKPNARFYQEIADRLSMEPSSCLMVGNDRRDDMVASSIGMSTYFLKDHARHEDEENKISYQGNSNEFYEFCKELPDIS